MDKLKRYIECYVPITTCNFRCSYCYITQTNKWGSKIEPIGHSPAEIRKALSKKRLGGTCLINLCGGGETLLCPQIVDIIRELLEEGHFVMVVTNGTITKALKEMADYPETLRKRLIFKFSYHYMEHHRMHITEQFFANIKMMKNAGCSFTLEVTPHDELISHIPELQDEVQEYLGTLCHVTIARNDTIPSIPILSELSDEEFYKEWGVFHSALFDFKKTIFGKPQHSFCYAGDWSVYVHLGTGNMTKCYAGKMLDNIYEHIDRPLHFEATGCTCKESHCYNGHAFLTLGDIPELDTPTYASLRDRESSNGNHWLEPEVREFLSGKLKDNNKEYPAWKKWLVNYKNK